MATVEVNKAILQTVLVLARELEENMRKKKQRKKRTLWVRHWISRRGRLGASNNLLRELKLEEPTDYKNFLRMNGQQFDQLLEKVKYRISKKDTAMREALSPQIKLEITLRYLATGDSFRSLEYLYRVPKSTISSFLVQVLEAVYEVLQEFIKVSVNNHSLLISAIYYFAIQNKYNNLGTNLHNRIKCLSDNITSWFQYQRTFFIRILRITGY